MSDPSPSGTSWRTLSVVAAVMVVAVVGFEMGLRTMAPMPRRNLEVDTGVRALAAGNPEVLVLGEDGDGEWVATTEVGLFADLPALAYAFDELPSGTVVYVELSVTDFGGNTASIDATVEIP